MEATYTTDWARIAKKRVWSDSSDYGTDGDTTDSLDVSWWGHCDLTAKVIIMESELTGNYNAPNGVIFTPSLKKGLLVALYHGSTNHSFYGYDILPHEWHDMMEYYIIEQGYMFAADIYNSGPDRDNVWNYPIYGIQNASYKEKTGQTDPRNVEITSVVSYWDGSSQDTLYYKYNVTYSNGGVASSSLSSDWMDHPSASPNNKRPDSAWYPNLQTSISSFWNGELNYSTIQTIIPLP